MPCVRCNQKQKPVNRQALTTAIQNLLQEAKFYPEDLEFNAKEMLVPTTHVMALSEAFREMAQ